MESLERTRRNMHTRFPNSLVQGYEAIIPTLLLPDPNDRHVLAVAIHARAECIITFNLDDFPKSVLQHHEIEVVPPDEFVLRLIRKVPVLVIQIAKNHRLSLSHPPLSVNEYLAMLEKQRLPKTVAFLSEHKNNI